MKKAFQITTTTCLLCVIPAQIFCESAKNLDVQQIAQDILVKAETRDFQGMNDFLNQLFVSIQEQGGTIERVHEFLQTFVTEMNIRNGCSFSMVDICHLIRQNSDSLNLSSEVLTSMLEFTDLLENYTRECLSEENQNSYLEKFDPHSQYFVGALPYFSKPTELFNSTIQSSKSSTIPYIKHQPPNKPVHKKSHNSSPEFELTLPNNLAFGCACILAGAILCILPFGVTQLAGTELIVMGAGFVGTGLVQGEKPYYENPKTGEIRHSRSSKK